MKYVANDGKVFETADECMQHEADLNNKGDKIKSLEAELERITKKMKELDMEYDQLDARYDAIINELAELKGETVSAMTSKDLADLIRAFVL